jgi:multiple sugar transport system permease protein
LVAEPVRRPASPSALGRLVERRTWAWLMLMPSLAILVVNALYPTLYGITLGFREMRLTRPDAGTGFVGVTHFLTMLEDEVAWLALGNTVLWVISAVGLELALGFASALVLQRRLPGLRAMTVLIVLPWFLPTVVVANMWALMLDPRLGVINDLMVRIGLLDTYAPWFAAPWTAFFSAVAIEAWRGFPFFTLPLVAALQAIPDELYDAAAVDGAGAIRRFRHVTLPLLKVVIAVTVILRVIGLVNMPDLLLVLTGGGPGHATQVVSLYAFETAYRAFDFGYAGALSTMTLVALAVFSYATVRVATVIRSA